MRKRLHKRMSALPTILWLMLLTLLPAQLSARDFKYNYERKTLTYTVISEDAKTVMTKVGDAYSAGNDVSGVLNIPSEVYDGETKYTVTEIGDYAFSGCHGLTSIKIPNSVTSIGEFAFEECSMLPSIEIPTSVTSIGNCAFSGCANLSSIEIPTSLTSISKRAFFRCIKLTSIKIPNWVTSIGDLAFDQCDGLSKIEIADGVNPIAIGSGAFYLDYTQIRSVYIGRNYTGNNWIGRVNSLVIGNNVSKISIFPESIRELTLGSGLTEIPERAFQGCSIKGNLVIPPNVTTIGNSAFEGNSLTNVIIGCGTATIGNNAFANNNGIATISVTAVNPPAATDDVFTTQDAKLNVLKDSREAYGNAPCWSQFKGADLVPVTVFKILGEPVPAARGANAAGTQIQFTATVEPADASLKDYIFWESSDPEVATIDNNGLVTLGEKEGKAEITARTLYAGVLATATVTSDGEVESGISDIFVDNADGVRPNDIYNLQGVCLKRNATQADIDALTPGLYIIAGKKVLVK